MYSRQRTHTILGCRTRIWTTPRSRLAWRGSRGLGRQWVPRFNLPDVRQSPGFMANLWGASKKGLGEGPQGRQHAAARSWGPEKRWESSIRRKPPLLLLFPALGCLGSWARAWQPGAGTPKGCPEGGLWVAVILLQHLQHGPTSPASSARSNRWVPPPGAVRPPWRW